MAKVRLADIAEKVGVSSVTVHNAITGQKGVSEEVRMKILRVAEEMGYQSASLNTKQESPVRFKNIGVLISERYLAEYTTFYWKMYQELSIVATEKKCLAAVEILKHEAEREKELPHILAESTVEGLIVMGEVDRDYIRNMRKYTRIPIVFLDFYDKELARDAVVTDNFYGMYLLTEYLIDHGIRRMAYVGSIHATSSIMDRYCGFYKALLEHHFDLPDKWLIEDRDDNGQVFFELPEKMPEAFVCNCDLLAGMVIEKLEAAGYQVPEDVSVIGFDNYLYPGFPDKQITTYEVNSRAMAKVALEKILKQIRNPRSGRGLDIVSGHIVEKGSVRKS